MNSKITVPKISVVTPNFNQADYLEETINSVLGQDYPNLEYIIIDGGSTDGSVAIIKSHEQQLFYWVSEPDNGMYDAINKGFERSTGDIMCWINSDDILHPGSLEYVAEIFNSHVKEVHWLQGYPNVIDEKGTIIYQRDPVATKWDFYKLKFTKDHKFIQQESTFWSRELWNRAKAFLNTDYRMAADFDLWMQFFENAKLYCSHKQLGAFRKRKGQQSENIEAYIKEAVNSVEVHRKKLSFADRLKLRFNKTKESINWID